MVIMARHRNSYRDSVQRRAHFSVIPSFPLNVGRKEHLCFPQMGIEALGSQAKNYLEVSESFLITEILAPTAPDRVSSTFLFWIPLFYQVSYLIVPNKHQKSRLYLVSFQLRAHTLKYQEFVRVRSGGNRRKMRALYIAPPDFPGGREDPVLPHLLSFKEKRNLEFYVKCPSFSEPCATIICQCTRKPICEVNRFPEKYVLQELTPYRDGKSKQTNCHRINRESSC